MTDKSIGELILTDTFDSVLVNENGSLKVCEFSLASEEDIKNIFENE